MRIDIEYPFTMEFDKAYLSISKKDGRGRVTLFRPDKTGTLISYARYLMSVKEGRYLETYEEVDHIDEDGTNDTLENLQILKIEDHIEKTLRNRDKAEMVNLVCAHCGKEFQRERRLVKSRKSSKSFCSSSCNGSYYFNESGFSKKVRKLDKFSDEDKNTILDMHSRGVSYYKIAEHFQQVSRNTIRLFVIASKGVLN